MKSEKVKKNLRILAVSILSALLVYGVFGFVSQEYDYKQWHWVWRLIGILLSIMATFIILDILEKPQPNEKR